MTQAHNKDILVDAFNTTRNVVLFFSINKSKAFQGVVSYTCNRMLRLRRSQSTGSYG